MNNYKVYEQFFAKVVEDGNYRRRGKVEPVKKSL